MGNDFKLCRITEVCDIVGLRPTAVYARVKTGTMPPPIKLTERASAWPLHELVTLNRARISGSTDAEIKTLTRELIEARKSAELTKPPSAPAPSKPTTAKPTAKLRLVKGKRTKRASAERNAAT